MDTPALPKRRNAARTKANILAAATRAFAEKGYSQVGIRDIAAVAGVSSTMLLRYFGSKAGLFEAALIEAMTAEGLFDIERERFGEYLTSQFIDPGLDITAPAMIALSSGDVVAREIASRVSNDHAIAALAEWLGPPDAHARAVQITMLSTSFVLYTRQIPVIPTADGVDQKMAAWLARTIQEIVDQS